MVLSTIAEEGSKSSSTQRTRTQLHQVWQMINSCAKDNMLLCTLPVIIYFIGLKLHKLFGTLKFNSDTINALEAQIVVYLGRREGERHCVEARRWAFEPHPDAEAFPWAFRIAIFVSCKISRNLFYALSLSLPETIFFLG